MSLLELSQVLGNFGEFVGAIAVVVTLVYLSLQVRHGKEAMQANTRSLDENRNLAMARAYHDFNESGIAYFMALSHSDYIPEIQFKATSASGAWDEKKIAQLSATERTRLHGIAMVLVLTIDDLHYQCEQGYFDKNRAEGFMQAMVIQAQDLWKGVGIDLEVVSNRPSFMRYVRSTLAAAKPAQQTDA